MWQYSNIAMYLWAIVANMANIQVQCLFCKYLSNQVSDYQIVFFS